MTDQAQTPKRIEPVYETSEPGKEILLIEDDEAKLKQENVEVKGKLTITQEWSPMGLFWEFSGSGVKDFSFGEVELNWKSHKASGRLFSIGQHRVSGYIQGKVEIGSDHKLDRVTFHLPDYPDLYGGQQFHDEVIEDGKTTSVSWSEVILEANGWRIRLQPHRDIHSLQKKARETRKVVLSGLGEISKSDGSQFKKKDVVPLLEALRIFLSFAFAEWSPPLLVVGSNNFAKKSCEFWSNYDVPPKSHLRGWVDDYHGRLLSDAFPGFMSRWSNENWQEPLELAVTWLIEASRQSGGTEGAIVLGQIPLEMLSWLVFVDDRKIVEDNEFDKLSAASKLQMLLAHCSIPSEVPSGLTTLSSIAAKEIQKKSGSLVSGPQLVTKVRNTIIHPNEKNRSLLEEWEKAYSVKVGEIRWDTQQLFKSYITLILLRLIGYSGKYANRLTPQKLNNRVELVPWASAPELPAPNSATNGLQTESKQGSDAMTDDQKWLVEHKQRWLTVFLTLAASIISSLIVVYGIFIGIQQQTAQLAAHKDEVISAREDERQRREFEERKKLCLEIMETATRIRHADATELVEDDIKRLRELAGEAFLGDFRNLNVYTEAYLYAVDSWKKSGKKKVLTKESSDHFGEDVPANYVWLQWYTAMLVLDRSTMNEEAFQAARRKIMLLLNSEELEGHHMPPAPEYRWDGYRIRPL